MELKTGKLYTAIKISKQKRLIETFLFKDIICKCDITARKLGAKEEFILLDEPILLDSFSKEYSYKILTKDGTVGYIWENSYYRFTFTKINE